jgi:hypothetical protein
MSDEDLKRMSTSRQTWRNELQVDDIIDVKIIGDDKDKTKGWVRG